MLICDLFHTLRLLLYSHLPSTPFISTERLGMSDSSNYIQVNCKGVKIVYHSPLCLPWTYCPFFFKAKPPHKLLLLAPFVYLCFSILLKSLFKNWRDFKIFQRFFRGWTNGKARDHPKNPFLKTLILFLIFCVLFSRLDDVFGKPDHPKKEWE